MRKLCLVIAAIFFIAITIRTICSRVLADQIGRIFCEHIAAQYDVGTTKVKITSGQFARQLDSVLHGVPGIDSVTEVATVQACESSNPPNGNYGVKISISSFGMAMASTKKLSRLTHVRLNECTKILGGRHGDQTESGLLFRKIFVLNGVGDAGFDPPRHPTANAFFICIDGD